MGPAGPASWAPPLVSRRARRLPARVDWVSSSASSPASRKRLNWASRKGAAPSRSTATTSSMAQSDTYLDWG